MSQSAQTKAGNLQIQVWERLQLAVGEAGKEGVYSCRVMDIEGDRLVISRPQFEYGNSLLAADRTISVRFTRADAAYSISARIQETEPKSPDTMHLTELGKVKRLQRRRFVRLDMVINLKYVVLPRPLAREVDVNQLRYIESRSHNLSAGGILITAAKSVKVGSLLLLDLTGAGLTSLPPMVCGICRQGRRLENNDYVAGLEFILKCDLGLHLTTDELFNLPERAKRFDSRLQNALVSELFTEQLTMRQKGIL